jgi:hypothetical protein
MTEEDAGDNRHDHQDHTDAERFAGKQGPAVPAPLRVTQPYS